MEEPKTSTFKNTSKTEFAQHVGDNLVVCAPGATCKAPSSMAETLAGYGLVEEMAKAAAPKDPPKDQTEGKKG